MRTAARFALGVGFVLGVLLSLGSRNSSGTYSLPAGNPVVSGTPISSTVHNATMSDLASEMTDSLNRSGKGAMLAALELVNGTAGTPALSFDSDTDTGLYRIGADNLGITIGGTKRWDMSTGTSALTGALTVSSTANITGAITGSAGATLTQSGSNTTGLTCTGNGTAAGAVITGGSSSGRGMTLLGGAPNGVGLHVTGDGTSAGIVVTGGDNNGPGIQAFAGSGGGTTRGIEATGATNGSGGYFTGGATGSGAEGNAGGSPTADTNDRFAFVAGNAHIKFTGGNPTSTTSFTNVLTPMNFIKAWARLDTSGAGATVVGAGFNVTNPQESGNNITLDFVADFSGTYACVVTPDNGSLYIFGASTNSVGTTTISALDNAGAAVNLGAGSISISIMCLGAN